MVKSIYNFSKFFIKFLLSIVILLSVLVAVVYIQNISITTTKIDIKSEKIAQSFDGYKIVQLSDIHNDYYGKRQDKLIKKIIKEEPDVIFITGDLVDSNRYEYDLIMPLMKQLVDIAPIYYVYGNHEQILYSDENKEFVDDVKSLGVHIINNMSDKIYKGDDYINILGIQDPVTTDVYKKIKSISTVENKMRYMLELVTEKIDKDKEFSILLSHRPEYTELYQEYNIDLTLTGHAHGGQIRIPFIGGLYAPHQGILPKYTGGVFTLGDSSVIINRGLGNSSMPIRIFNVPEIVSITLKNNN